MVVLERVAVSYEQGISEVLHLREGFEGLRLAVDLILSHVRRRVLYWYRRVQKFVMGTSKLYTVHVLYVCMVAHLRESPEGLRLDRI